MMMMMMMMIILVVVAVVREFHIKSAENQTVPLKKQVKPIGKHPKGVLTIIESI